MIALLKPCFGLLVLAVTSSPAASAILLEATIRGQAVQFEIGENPDRVLYRSLGHDYLVDLSGQTIHQLTAGGVSEVSVPTIDRPIRSQPLRISQWGPGPPVAGYRSTFHVIQLDEQICAEVLASGWMQAFLLPIVRSLALLERLQPSLRSHQTDSDCGAIPFEVLARNGWPLMAGSQDNVLYLTETVSFDHQVDGELFRLPYDPLLAPDRDPR